MAGFKTHTGVGAFTGLALVMAAFSLEWVSTASTSFSVFFAAMIGSFLPDLDSDSGLPYQILFGFYSLLASAIAYFVFYSLFGKDVLVGVVAAALFFVFFRFVIGPLFQKYTEHRGIMHSIPFCLLSFFMSLMIISIFNYPLLVRFVISLAVFAGCLSHLVLDEIYSTNILSGKFKPKKSLGTALKMFSRSPITNIAMYMMLAALMYLTSSIWLDIYHTLTH